MELRALFMDRQECLSYHSLIPLFPCFYFVKDTRSKLRRQI